MSTNKHLFFDLDRTLWDFEANSKKALEVLFTDLDIHQKIDHFNHFHHTYIRVNAELWKLYGKGKIDKDELRDSRFVKTLEYHQIFDNDLALKMSNGYLDLSPRQTLLLPNAIEILTELKALGYPMHIITNGFEEVQHIKLKNSNLIDFFDIIVCSEAVGFTKPDIRVFNYALQQANAVAQNSIMIGDDREIDVFGAIQAGMTGILFDPENQYPRNPGDLKIANLNELPLLLAMLN